MNSNKKVINIVGAGAYGCFLSFLLAKQIYEERLNVSVVLHEKGSTILPGWLSVKVSSFSVNNGFHGLEMPRAKLAFDILESLVSPSFFRRIPNVKLCLLGDYLIPFRSELSDWPASLRDDLVSLTHKQSKLFQANPLSFADFQTFFQDTYLFNILKLCSTRYSDNLKCAWGSFYRYFFPI